MKCTQHIRVFFTRQCFVKNTGAVYRPVSP